MLIKNFLTAFLATSFLVGAGSMSLHADTPSGKASTSQKQKDSDSADEKNQDEARSGGSKPTSESLTGEGSIQATKKVKVTGTTIENLVVLVKMKKPDSNQTVTRIVDLGPVKDLKSLKVRQGDQIKTSGRVVQIKDRQVLMADEITSHNETLTVKRQKPKKASKSSKGG